jgi:hypothetical protein
MDKICNIRKLYVRYTDLLSKFRGLEEIITNAPTQEESVYALIDLGTLHLEALEYAKQSGGRHPWVAHPEWIPVSFEAHRTKTDSLLAQLK